MSTLLITGGAGSIGRHLGRAPIDAGRRVRVLQAHGELAERGLVA